MSDDRWSQWQAEYAGTNRLPGIWSAFLLLALVALVLVALLGGLGALEAAAGESPARQPGSFCDEKAGRPGWDAVCAETARRS